ncbi:MAG: hypothetical protein AVDCRST_MAG67-4105, partial [uncultured Solirubrobacteraceae bacterium]
EPAGCCGRRRRVADGIHGDRRALARAAHRRARRQPGVRRERAAGAGAARVGGGPRRNRRPDRPSAQRRPGPRGRAQPGPLPRRRRGGTRGAGLRRWAARDGRRVRAGGAPRGDAPTRRL